MHAYIDAHIQRLVHEYTGYGVLSISIFQTQCENMTLSEQIIYNRMFQQVFHKGGESSINYIKRFQNDKALTVSM